MTDIATLRWRLVGGKQPAPWRPAEQYLTVELATLPGFTIDSDPRDGEVELGGGQVLSVDEAAEYAAAIASAAALASGLTGAELDDLLGDIAEAAADAVANATRAGTPTPTTGNRGSDPDTQDPTTTACCADRPAVTS